MKYIRIDETKELGKSILNLINSLPKDSKAVSLLSSKDMENLEDIVIAKLMTKDFASGLATKTETDDINRILKGD